MTTKTKPHRKPRRLCDAVRAQRSAMRDWAMLYRSTTVPENRGRYLRYAITLRDRSLRLGATVPKRKR